MYKQLAINTLPCVRRPIHFMIFVAIVIEIEPVLVNRSLSSSFVVPHRINRGGSTYPSFGLGEIIGKISGYLGSGS